LDHEIVVMLCGRASYVRRDGVHELEAGDLILIRPFVPHAFHFTGRTVEHLAIHFDFSPGVPVPTRRHTPYEVKLGNDLHLAEHSKARVSPWARAVALRILESWSKGSVLGALAARAELLLLLVRLASVFDGRAARAHPQTGDSTAEAAVRSALSKSSALRSVGDLARVAGLSPSHLRRVVRALVGQSPAAYLRQEQVNRARRLLADPSRSIKSVALDAGFANPHHFSRVFRQVDGLTPSEYRASASGE
jgi:AraC-like DNA-binding protein